MSPFEHAPHEAHPAAAGHHTNVFDASPVGPAHGLISTLRSDPNSIYSTAFTLQPPRPIAQWEAPDPARHTPTEPVPIITSTPNTWAPPRVAFMEQQVGIVMPSVIHDKVPAFLGVKRFMTLRKLQKTSDQLRAAIVKVDQAEHHSKIKDAVHTNLPRLNTHISHLNTGTRPQVDTLLDTKRHHAAHQTGSVGAAARHHVAKHELSQPPVALDTSRPAKDVRKHDELQARADVHNTKIRDIDRLKQIKQDRKITRYGVAEKVSKPAKAVVSSVRTLASLACEVREGAVDKHHTSLANRASAANREMREEFDYYNSGRRMLGTDARKLVYGRAINASMRHHKLDLVAQAKAAKTSQRRAKAAQKQIAKSLLV
jgi:hypothetical protein